MFTIHIILVIAFLDGFSFLLIYNVSKVAIIILQQHMIKNQPTLLHTPVELYVQVFQKHGAEDFKILSKHVHDGIQSMVTGGSHPLVFLHMSKIYEYL